MGEAATTPECYECGKRLHKLGYRHGDVLYGHRTLEECGEDAIAMEAARTYLKSRELPTGAFMGVPLGIFDRDEALKIGMIMVEQARAGDMVDRPLGVSAPSSR